MSVHRDPKMMSRHPARARWSAAFALVVVGLGCRPTAKKATTPAPDPTLDGTFTAVPPSNLGASTAPPVPLGPQAEVLSSSIRKVTVYSDRALVTREATATLGKEPTVYAFRQLPGWVDDGSVRVSTSAGRILDVRVQRSYLARASDEAYRQAELKAQELANQMAALDDEVKILDAQTKQIESIKAFSLDKITKDMTVGNINVDSYGSVVEFISNSLRDTAKARRAVEVERARLAPSIEASGRQLTEMRGLTQLEETSILVTLEGPAKTKARLELIYMLPGATWEPMHELRVSAANPKSVEVTSFAVVTQTGGEDWNHAEMTFSTQSSTESVRIPELEALTLGDTKTATQILKRQSASFRRAQAAFDQQNLLWNKQRQKSAYRHNFEEVYQSNYDYLQVVQSKTVQIFQSLQKRGTTAHFTAIGTANVRADGRSVRLPIGRTRLDSVQKIVAAPEQSLNAARTLEMTNSSGQPLLPGRVALYQDGAFLGMTELDFIAEGERFALFLNVADHLKLTRTLDKKQSSLVRKTRTRMQVAFIVTVENLSSKTAALTLADRIPVSENRAITISKVKITPAVKPDSKGILYWPLTLKPKEKRRFRIQYQVEYPPTLILETKRNRARAPSPSPAQRRRRPQKQKMYNLEEDLVDLESNF